MMLMFMETVVVVVLVANTQWKWSLVMITTMIVACRLLTQSTTHLVRFPIISGMCKTEMTAHGL